MLKIIQFLFNLLIGIRRARLAVVVDRIFTLVSLDLHTSLLTDHRRIILFSRVKFSQLDLTAKLF